MDNQGTSVYQIDDTCFKYFFYLEPCPQPFLLELFSDRVMLFSQDWDYCLPTCASCEVGSIDPHHHAQLAVEMGSCQLLPGLASNQLSS
jgi:hypothetical protein